MAMPDYDVSIVGFGPVGAFCALLLAAEGLRVSIHERSTEALELPRAVGLDGESLRAFQSIGQADTISALLQPPRENEELQFANSKREKLFGIPMPDEEGHHGWRDLAFFDQPELEAALRERVADDPSIDVFLGEEAIGIDDRGDGVGLTLRNGNSGRDRSVRCRFLIGSDGASSFVRRDRGIGWSSLGYDQDWLVVDITAAPDAPLPTALMQVCDPARLTTYVCVKDPNRRWEFQLCEGETREEMLRPERIRGLLDDWLPEEDYTLRRAAVYQFHAATADQWRVGRVLLAGDAAHQTPPFLGQGLNAGLRDAFNLGWKIPLVIRGLCDDALLDSYFDERDAHARDLVEAAVGIGKLMETLAAREAGRPDPYPGSTPSGRVVPDRAGLRLRAGALRMEQQCDEIPVGLHLRQAHLRRRETSGGVASSGVAAGGVAKSGVGETRRLDDWLGRGFALVGREHADLALAEREESIAARLGFSRLALEDFECIAGELDRVFERYPTVLLRPDRTIFGVVDDATPVEALFACLTERIALRPDA